jgi:two-component system chemotaxis response regulator CheB
MTTEPIRVLVVDDTSLYRKLLSDVLRQIEGTEVVGTAGNGTIALAKVAQAHPDVLTLDVEMPAMDGLETLRRLRAVAPQVGVIMVSAHTTQGAKITMEALDLGALDFITKPEGKDPAQNMADLRRQLHPLLSTFRTRKRVKSLLRSPNGPVSRRPAAAAQARGTLPLPAEPGAPRPAAPPPSGRIDIVAIGVSTGGPQALAQLIPQLPGQLGVPIVVVQHMPPMFTAALAESLDRKSALTVVEGQHEQILAPNTVYLAPGGKHMKIVRQGAQQHPCLLITNDPPENHCKPSVDYLFRSVAQGYGNRALGVIMTGMGADGTLGLRLMKRQGATVLAQDEASCVVFGMPLEAIKAGVVDAVVPLEQLALAVCQRVSRR